MLRSIEIEIENAIQALDDFSPTDNEQVIEYYEYSLNENQEFDFRDSDVDYATFLQQNDPIMYSEGLNDYVDMMEKDGTIKELDEYADLLEELENALEAYKDFLMSVWN